MAIKFICACGQHLKARDDMAARRVLCPRCRTFVGVPSLQPTHPGTAAAPMTPEERRRRTRPVPEEGVTPAPDPAPPAPLPEVEAALAEIITGTRNRPRRTGRHLEKRAAEFLLGSLRTWHLCLALGLLLAILSAAIAQALPELLAAWPSDFEGQAIYFLLAIPLVVLFVGIPCGFLECVLAAAVAGEKSATAVAGSLLQTALLGGLKWLACFFAGPVVFAGVACLYWLYCGEPALFDWLMLAELGVVSLTYWIFALLALTDGGRLRNLNPVTVVDLAYRLGWRGQVLAVAAACLLLAHGLVLGTGLAELHSRTLLGWLLLIAGWMSALLCGTFFCRWLGVWCHLSRPALPAGGRRRDADGRCSVSPSEDA